MNGTGALRAVLVWVGLFFLNGCLSTAPELTPSGSGVPVPAAYQLSSQPAGPGVSGAPSVTPADAWWREFDDDHLNRIVDDVLRHNRDIEKAGARLLELRMQWIQTRAERYPSVNLQVEAQRLQNTVTTTVPVFEGGQLSMQTASTRQFINAYNLALPASYEIDLWKRLSDTEAAARADLLQARETRHTIAQGIVAETTGLYFQMESIERRIAITRQRIRSYAQNVRLLENRYLRGLTSILDVRQARRAQSQAAAELPDLLNTLGTIQHRICLLAGKYPEIRDSRQQPDAYFKKLAPVPVGLPADLINRRPDIRAAAARLDALNSRVRVAAANRLPRLTLTGSLGYVSNDLSLLFRPESELFRIASGIAAPVFNAGKLKAGQKAAEARFHQGLADYAKSLLTAFAEVEGALLARQQQMQRRENLLAFLTEARATQEIAENRYLRGLVDYLRVLEAQQTRFAAEQQVVLVDLALLTNRVALYRALGGGWGQPGPIPRSF